MLNNDCFEDHTSVWSSELVSYHWIYDPGLRLLMLMPDLNQLSGVEKQLWLKILKACQLQQWMQLMQEVDTSNLVKGRFILNMNALQLMIKTFSPKSIWFIGDEAFLQNLPKLKDSQLLNTSSKIE